MTLNECDYTRDGKFVSVQGWKYKDGDSIPTEVPTALLDELLERELTSHELQKLLFFRRLTRGRNFRRATMQELVGEDLTGKQVVVYFRNWEDSEIVYSTNAVTVVTEAGDPFESECYAFAFPQEWKKCDNYECGHEEKGEDCPYETLQGMSFYATDTVIIIEPEEEPAK